LPGWGTIFSSHVCFIRPDGEEEESTFLDLVAAYLKVLRSAVQVAEADPVDGITTISRFEGQRQYCLQQRRNDKTRRVLEKAFNTTWADRYISELLFDDPPRPS
jgi:phycocyanobilin:ferredoxin oxidoreductase